MSAKERDTAPVATSFPAWAAFWWSLLFGLVSLYWAAGGEIGILTLAQTIQDSVQEGDPDTGDRSPEDRRRGRGAGDYSAMGTSPALPFVAAAGWSHGRALALYGLAGFIEKVLMATGVIDIPAAFGEDAVIWYLVLWEPIWMLGGVLFLLTAWRFRVKRGRSTHW